MNQQNKTFEENMHRLEQIVRTMERGDVPLEESLKLFQEGTELVRCCGKLLDGPFDSLELIGTVRRDDQQGKVLAGGTALYDPMDVAGADGDVHG